MPRILAITAGTAGKRNPITLALADLYGAEVLPGQTRAEGALDRVWRKLALAERIGTHAANLRAVNRAILERAGRFDILFVVKGNLVTAATLAALRARPVRPKIVGWSCDDIWLPHNQSPVLRAAARFYDLFFTAKSLNITNGELAAMGFANPRFLPQGFDRDWHRPLPDPASRFAGLVTFVGFGERDRFDKINHLARNGVPVHVWGNGWTRAMRAAAHPDLHIHGHPLTGDDYADALSNSAISLCFLRKQNRDLHTSRSFEIPACGGFMLAERTDEHREYFSEGAEAIYFDNSDELLRQARRWLADPEGRARIAAAARARCLASNYSYHSLAQDIVTQVCLNRMSAGEIYPSR
jgi:spore maturation protein CgeB